jgi:predicted ATP-grasp superfamily ATP-dependent carboligase
VTRSPGAGTRGGDDRLLVVGASARALAASAAGSRRVAERFPAGILALDHFGDTDLEEAAALCPVRVLSIERHFGLPRTTAALGRAALLLGWTAVAYGGALENRPGLLRRFARRGTLLGIGGPAVRAVRDPSILFPALAAAGIAHPEIVTCDRAPEGRGRWLVKPRRSGGGHGVRIAQPGERRRPGDYFQEFLEGPCGSIAALAGGGEAIVLGASEQIVGWSVLGASGYRYAGSIAGPCEALLPPESLETLRRAATHLAARFGLAGLFGVDYILRDRVPHVIEINPRWTASMELIEERTGDKLFDRHLEALEGGPLSGAPAAARSPEPARIAAPAAPRFLAKGILFADSRVTLSDPTALQRLGARDRPRRGEIFAPGQPVCTLMAAGASPDECRAGLAGSAAVARELLKPAPAW